MADYTPVTQEAFGTKTWQRNQDFTFAKQQTLIPLIANEVGLAACSVPMAFAEVSGKMTLVMVCSLQPSQNLMVAPNGKWAIGFVPTALSCRPFRLASSGDKYTLAVDASSDLVSEEGVGIPFFQENSALPSAETKEVLQQLLNGHRGNALTQRAAAALAEAQVLEPWNIVVKGAEGEHQISGLSKLNETALNALPDKQLLLLRQSGALAIAYAQLISVHQLSLLKRLSGMHAASSASHAEHTKLFSPDQSKAEESFDWQTIFKST